MSAPVTLTITFAIDTYAPLAIMRFLSGYSRRERPTSGHLSVEDPAPSTNFE